jgi:hypothetical protein
MVALCLGHGERRRRGLSHSWQRTRRAVNKRVAHDARMGEGESCALPVIRGPRWFGPEPKQFVLRAEIPVTFDEMVAVLYGTTEPDDLASAEDLCGAVVVGLVVQGLAAADSRAAEIRGTEHGANVESPEFLSLCRRRVAALIAST